jgi:hypothetical protein
VKFLGIKKVKVWGRSASLFLWLIAFTFGLHGRGWGDRQTHVNHNIQGEGGDWKYFLARLKVLKLGFIHCFFLSNLVINLLEPPNAFPSFSFVIL